MPDEDLDDAAKAARYLASMSASIRGLMEDDEDADVIMKLRRELNQSYADAREAIRNMAMELRRTRDSSVRIGGVVAPTAHEAAIEMVQVLNRERFGVEVIGRKQVAVWPDVDEVVAEIEIEFTKAKHHRQTLVQQVESATPQYVKRQPIADYVDRSKDWLADQLNDRDDAPQASNEKSGGSGVAFEYVWDEALRSWLEELVGREMPERFPSLFPPD